MTVRDGGTTTSKALGVFSGNQIPKIIMGTATDMWMRFSSDYAYNFRGFNATYKEGEAGFFLVNSCNVQVICCTSYTLVILYISSVSFYFLLCDYL